jgi:beta-phosphoglucomutase-like phosphatase (HAD superfamily)
MINIDDYDVFIFDCDGVILDSNKLKSEAFQRALTSEDKSDVEILIQYHKDNGGISRYEKFNYFYTEICPSLQKDLKVKQALESFAEIVSEEMLSVDLIPGILNFLKKISFLNKKIFVNSGSDETELNDIFRSRNLASYFEKIFGSPSNKIQNIERISHFNKIDDRAIFFGDSISDHNAAKGFGMEFVFISGYSEWKHPDPSIKYQFVDFNEILKVLS